MGEDDCCRVSVGEEGSSRELKRKGGKEGNTGEEGRERKRKGEGGGGSPVVG